MKIFLILFILLSSSLFSIEVNVGGGIFHPEVKGTIQYQNNFLEGSTATVDNTPSINEDYKNIYLWTDIELPLPYNPHLLIEYNHIVSKGKSFFNVATTNDAITDLFKDVISALKTNTSNGLPRFTILTNNIYDVFVYTDIFEDESLPTIAFGAGLKNFDYTFFVPIFTDYDLVDDGGATIPMLYTRFKKELEEYPLSFEVGMKYYVFGDSDIYDLNAKVQMKVEVNKHIKLGLEIGYKDMNFKIKGNDIDTVGGKMRYNGIFGGLTASLR